jgi:ABC-type Mn2+/Zn2+ transport system permease subunit
MNTIDYLFSRDLAPMYWPGLLAGLAIALMAAPLSLLVVLKRLAFIGQGVSHAAFGGVGLSALIGASLGVNFANALGGVPQLAIVLGFCAVSGLVIAGLSGRRASADTAIGVVLVASMALGAILMHQAHAMRSISVPAWESVLFGAILAVDVTGLAVAALAALLVLGVLAWHRRGLMFWTVDEAAAPAFGLRVDRLRFIVMLLLTLAVVVSMKLAGVVLSTALLVLPGAAALLITNRWRVALALATMFSVLGVLIGLVLAFEIDWPPGPSIVLVLSVVYALARLLGIRVHARSKSPAGVIV